MGGAGRGLVFLLAAGLAFAPAAAEPLARGEVPEPLAAWVDWVLRGHEAESCPGLHAQAGRRACVWPSRLELELGEGQETPTWIAG